MKDNHASADNAEAISYSAEDDAWQNHLGHMQMSLERLAHATSWIPRQLDFNNIVDPKPEFLPRTDGVCLLLAGRSHSFIGASESMKTTAAFLAVIDFLRRGLKVMYIDCERSAGYFTRRMIRLGVTPQELARVCYIRPSEAMVPRYQAEPGSRVEAAKEAWMIAGMTYLPALVVIDGVSEMFSMHGWDVNSATDVAVYQNSVLNWVSMAGSADVTLEIDHVAKHQGEHTALGSQHKKAGITGASYLFVPSIQGHEGGISSSVISVQKDAEGVIESSGPDRVMGVLQLDSSVVPWKLEILPPGDLKALASGPAPISEEEITALLEKEDMGTVTIAGKLHREVPAVRRFCKAMEAQGKIRRRSGKTSPWRLIRLDRLDSP